MSQSYESLPPNLPVPEDDGAADHLAGMALPEISLPSTAGVDLDLRHEAVGTLVLYIYPRTGKPGVPLLPGLGRDPGRAGLHAGVVRVPRRAR